MCEEASLIVVEVVVGEVTEREVVLAMSARPGLSAAVEIIGMAVIEEA